MLLRLLLLVFLIIAGPVLAERRVALVLAAEDYRHLRPLQNPLNDARAMEDLLEGLGFSVTVETDRDLRRMRRALEDFAQDGAGADVALVFFAGHGVEIAGLNYLMPVDAEAGTATAVAASALPLAEVQAALAKVAPIGIVLLDACRADPFGAGDGGEGRSAVALDDAPTVPGAVVPRPGLGRIGRADGVLFAFSAAPGEVAADGAGTDSPFTEALLRHFATPGVEVRTALTLVQQDVYDRSRGRQLPYIESGLPQLFFVAAKGDLPERDRLLLAMAGLSPALRAEIEALARENDMPLAPLYAALLSAGLGEKEAGARSDALRESAAAYLRFRADLQRLSAEDPEVAELRVRAEKELDLGSYDAARVLLQDAARIDAEARAALRDNYRARTLSEAQTHALAAAAARSDLRYDLAMTDLDRALALYGELEGPELARDDRVAFTDLYWDLGDLYRLLGNSALALRAYRGWAAVAAARVDEAPDDGEWLRNKAVADNNIGDMLFARGDLAGAEATFQGALALVEPLARRPDAPMNWRHDVFVTQSKLGDLAAQRGDFAAALRLQLAGQEVVRALVADYPERDDVRRDLAVASDRVGDLRLKTGDTAGARAAFDEALALRQSLLDVAPDNPARQYEMTTSLDKLGDLLLQQGDTGAATARFAEEVARLRALAAGDPGNTGLQRALTVALAKLGDGWALTDRAQASALYDEALDLRAALVALDPDNAQWQRDLAVIHVKRGDLAAKADDTATAEMEYSAALAIAEALAAADPGDALNQQELGAVLDRIGDMAMLRGDAGAAQVAYGRSYAAARALAALSPENVDYQIGIVTSLFRLSLFDDDPNPRMAEAVAILEELQRQGRLDPLRAGWIAMLRAAMQADAP